MRQCGSKHPWQSSRFSGCSLHNTTKIPKHLCHKHSLIPRLLHMGRSLGMRLSYTYMAQVSENCVQNWKKLTDSMYINTRVQYEHCTANHKNFMQRTFLCFHYHHENFNMHNRVWCSNSLWWITNVVWDRLSQTVPYLSHFSECEKVTHCLGFIELNRTAGSGIWMYVGHWRWTVIAVYCRLGNFHIKKLFTWKIICGVKFSRFLSMWTIGGYNRDRRLERSYR